MALWKSPWLVLDAKNYGGVEQALLQHKQLLEVSGFPCKVLFKKTRGEEVGNEVEPIVVATWDDTSPAPKKIIWQAGNDEVDFPDTRSVRVWVDGIELVKTYDASTIQTDNEFYIVADVNIVGIDDNVALYLNDGFDLTGKVVTYLYTTIAKNINVAENLHPSDYPNTFRTEFQNGFTQYVNPISKFRGRSYPNTILITFPVNPFETVYIGGGKYQQQEAMCWTMGDRIGYPTLHEFDIIYRTDTQEWYEIKTYNPNYIYLNHQSILATQSFTTALISPTDSIRGFNLL